MRTKQKWMVAGALCLLSITGFFLVLAVGNRASVGSKVLSEMLQVPKPEELGVVVPPGPLVSQTQAQEPPNSPSLQKVAPTTQEVKQMEREGAIAY